jgi:hypothetical protein
MPSLTREGYLRKENDPQKNFFIEFQEYGTTSNAPALARLGDILSEILVAVAREARNVSRGETPTPHRATVIVA